ncbi:VOC family protein [Aliikangiella sp. G2MR2-5]|uniref:VOC family protein n=1 Tax=Aliikangiella sp. G2MR2-5 TaxID=2788943 RepID=UPI0018AC5BD3|nr:VOC family protein [Aliikangiella sp. G2MR2-5]
MKMDHIVIMLSDLKVNLSFYETLLPLIGFSKIRDHVFANEDGNHLDIKQAPEAEHEYRRFAPGLNHIGFTAKDRDEIVSIQETMANAGFEVPEIQEFPDGSAIFFKDKDGMRIEVATYN